MTDQAAGLIQDKPSPQDKPISTDKIAIIWDKWLVLRKPLKPLEEKRVFDYLESLISEFKKNNDITSYNLEGGGKENKEQDIMEDVDKGPITPLKEIKYHNNPIRTHIKLSADDKEEKGVWRTFDFYYFQDLKTESLIYI